MTPSDPLRRAARHDELLAQMPWVQRLARGLLRDAHAADDVAQETLALALERPPRASSGPGLRAWLARVVRTTARQHARGDQRRRQREERAAGAGKQAEPATADVVERAALQRRVSEAVLALDEPYRSAVLYRYLDGLDAPAIARRTGVSADAARKRVSRGLEQLRERFERDEGPRWTHGLSLLVLADKAGPTISTVASGAAMSTSLKIAAGIAAAAALALTWKVSRAETEPLTEVSAGEVAAELSAPSDDGPGVALAGSTTRRAATRTVTGPQPAAAEQPWNEVRGIVLDPDGQPAAGAVVRATVPTVDETVLAASRIWGPGVRMLSARTDVEGRFALELSEGLWRVWGGRLGLRWDRSEELRVERRGKRHELVLTTSELPRENRIDGRVLAPDGAPVAGARIWCRWPSLDHELPIGSNDEDDKTDAEGRFRIPSADAGVHRVRATHPDKTFGPILADAELGGPALVLRFAETRWLTIDARDPNGYAVEDFRASVKTPEDAGFMAFDSARSERGGPRLTLPSTHFTVSVWAEGFAPFELGPLDPGGFREAENTLECELTRLAVVSGTLSAGGQPVRGDGRTYGGIVQLARTADPRRTDFLYGFPVRLDGSGLVGTYTDSEGRFALTIKEPGEYALFAEAEGWAAVELGPMRLDSMRSETFDLELVAGGVIEGRVLGAELESEDRVTVRASRGDLRTKETLADEHGNFRLAELTPGPWMVTATLRQSRSAGAGMAAMAIRKVTSEEDFVFPWDCEVRDGETTYVDIRLDRDDRREVAGSVRVDGVGEAYGMAKLRPHTPAFGLQDHSPHRCPLDLEGRFRFENVTMDELWLTIELSGGPLAGTQLVRQLEEGEPPPALDHDLASATVELAPEFAAGSYALLTEVGATTAVRLLPPGPDGLPLPTPVVAGRARLVRRGPDLDPDRPLAWPVRARLELAPGARIRVAPSRAE